MYHWHMSNNKGIAGVCSLRNTYATICFHIKKIYQNSSLFVCLMLSNVPFNNISFISWLSVLLVKETGVTGEIYRPVASH